MQKCERELRALTAEMPLQPRCKMIGDANIERSAPRAGEKVDRVKRVRSCGTTLRHI
jgi:hypothetical protein